MAKMYKLELYTIHFFSIIFNIKRDNMPIFNSIILEYPIPMQDDITKMPHYLQILFLPQIGPLVFMPEMSHSKQKHYDSLITNHGLLISFVSLLMYPIFLKKEISLSIVRFDMPNSFAINPYKIKNSLLVIR